MITLENLLKSQTEMFQNCQQLAREKGADYNRTQQEKGDTLFNLRVAHLLGLVDSPAQSVMVRILDKVMRMVSLTGADPQVKSETIRDTALDIINYATYWVLLKEEEDPPKKCCSTNIPEEVKSGKIWLQDKDTFPTNAEQMFPNYKKYSHIKQED